MLNEQNYLRTPINNSDTQWLYSSLRCPRVAKIVFPGLKPKAALAFKKDNGVLKVLVNLKWSKEWLDVPNDSMLY